MAQKIGAKKAPETRRYILVGRPAIAAAHGSSKRGVGGGGSAGFLRSVSHSPDKPEARAACMTRGKAPRGKVQG